MTSSSSESRKQNFIDFIIRKKAITFGDFTTKSGRKTPYFINLGNICSGQDIRILGEMYAETIINALADDFDNLFGPAYKGIPLVVATAAALDRQYGRYSSFTYNRKEVKDHGEKGILVGHQYVDGDRIVILEDVVTAGTSVYETVPLLKSAANICLKALVVSVDRQERGKTGKSALEEIAETLHVETYSIVTLDDIISYIRTLEIDGKPYLTDSDLTRVQNYRREYGI